MTITISGLHQETFGAPGPENCFTFSPNPAAVLTNQGIIFYNASSVALTVDYRGGIPFKSLQPGQQTAAFSFDTPAERDYVIDACPNDGSGDMARVLVTSP